MVSKKDILILSILQEGARTPVSEIAKQVGLSENGVRYRLDKLEEEGYIKNYVVLLNPKKFGKNTFAIFNLEMEPKKMKAGINKLLSMEEFTRIYQTTGQYSIKAFGLFDDDEDLTNFINEKLLTELPVHNYSVEIVTKNIKDTIYNV
ncbi:Lrp/AsnC family transcriptional regulator [Methanolobus zinderi]|uniref:Lrp/AsnC family transcriptional regulator n=1 Tax=Methanolobus zinderi TaxID=536044 RepID=A0A7D5IQK4_9EURY|nr:Lrp/AsnC family transcriptional regulator [Methanolobus zinderi]QLC51005.1 Lrp/AsnC family transcriptional regulator [Methanolobus zinderi]